MSDEFDDKDVVDDVETGSPETEDDNDPPIIPDGFSEDEFGM